MTWTTLTSGLVGSALASTLTFAAAAWTVRRTRAADQRREDLRQREREEYRREAVVAEVLGAPRSLESEVRLAPLLMGRATAGMLQATMRFYLVQRARHPMVAGWLLEQQQTYEVMVSHWRKVWWVPFLSRRRLTAVGSFLGAVVGALVAWSVGRLDELAFADPSQSALELVGGQHPDDATSEVA